jgi:leucyl aminopeptidase|tara:strand:- start:12187 stop:13728 length:1542 start_codon:yes stop_codon:yes gene_type:complete
MTSTKLNIICSKGYSNEQTLVLPIFTDKKGKILFGAHVKEFNKGHGGLITDTIDALPAFDAAPGQTSILAAPKGSTHQNIILLGLGQPENLDSQTAETIGQALYATLKTQKIGGALLKTEDHKRFKYSASKVYANIANAAYEASYEFDKYKSNAAEANKIKFLTVTHHDVHGLKEEFENATAVSNGRVWARDLGNEPPNMLYPETYASQIQEKLGPLGVKTHVISYEDMQKLGMGAALAVGGSATHKPCMVVMEYDGTNNEFSAPVGLVGKGVTYDTGGYSLKPSGSQIGMKFDMCGSAAVVGTMQALAEKKAAVKVTAIVGLVENRIAPDAYLVDDVITSMAGKTIEIKNTDAEGRLVLADALTYLQRKHKPHTVVDVATLTGAVVAALGHNRAGLFTESQTLRDNFTQAAKNSGEAIELMPLDDEHRQAMIGKIADLSNGANTSGMGASTAAGFLSYFIEGETKWAHLDIAGTAIPPSGMATGYGVKLLSEWVESNYAQATVSKPVKGPKV